MKPLSALIPTYGSSSALSRSESRSDDSRPPSRQKLAPLVAFRAMPSLLKIPFNTLEPQRHVIKLVNTSCRAESVRVNTHVHPSALTRSGPEEPGASSRLRGAGLSGTAAMLGDSRDDEFDSGSQDAASAISFAHAATHQDPAARLGSARVHRLSLDPKPNGGKKVKEGTTATKKSGRGPVWRVSSLRKRLRVAPGLHEEVVVDFVPIEFLEYRSAFQVVMRGGSSFLVHLVGHPVEDSEMKSIRHRKLVKKRRSRVVGDVGKTTTKGRRERKKETLGRESTIELQQLELFRQSQAAQKQLFFPRVIDFGQVPLREMQERTFYLKFRNASREYPFRILILNQNSHFIKLEPLKGVIPWDRAPRVIKNKKPQANVKSDEDAIKLLSEFVEEAPRKEMRGVAVTIRYRPKDFNTSTLRFRLEVPSRPHFVPIEGNVVGHCSAHNEETEKLHFEMTAPDVAVAVGKDEDAKRRVETGWKRMKLLRHYGEESLRGGRRLMEKTRKERSLLSKTKKRKSAGDLLLTRTGELDGFPDLAEVSQMEEDSAVTTAQAIATRKRRTREKLRELDRKAAEFAKREIDKEIKWFPEIGSVIPSTDECEEILAERDIEARGLARQDRSWNRALTTTALGGLSPVVDVELKASVLRERGPFDPEEEGEEEEPAVAVPVAAEPEPPEGVVPPKPIEEKKPKPRSAASIRKTLLQEFRSLVSMAVVRHRVEHRLRKLEKSSLETSSILRLRKAHIPILSRNCNLPLRKLPFKSMIAAPNAHLAADGEVPEFKDFDNMRLKVPLSYKITGYEPRPISWLNTYMRPQKLIDFGEEFRRAEEAAPVLDVGFVTKVPVSCYCERGDYDPKNPGKWQPARRERMDHRQPTITCRERPFVHFDVEQGSLSDSKVFTTFSSFNKREEEELLY